MSKYIVQIFQDTHNKNLRKKTTIAYFGQMDSGIYE